MDEQKKFLLKILDIIDYEGEKESFADMFTELLLEEVAYTLIQSQPEKKREKLGKMWDKNIENHAALSSMLRHYFTPEEITQTSEVVSKNAMEEYLMSVNKGLSDEQKRKLQQLTEGDAFSPTPKKGGTHLRTLMKN